MRPLGLAFAALASCVIAGQASATPIPVANNSFESPTGLACPTSWTCQPGASSSDVGVYAPGAAQYNSNGTNGLPNGSRVPDGSQVLFINDFNGQGAQVVFQNVATIADQTTYSLDVWVGHRLDFGWEVPELRLLANGSLLTTSGSLADPGVGKWADYSLSYTTIAGDSHSGQNLSVELYDNDPRVGQVNFDLVSLNASSRVVAVPEPSSLFLLVPGLFLLMMSAGRARKSS